MSKNVNISFLVGLKETVNIFEKVSICASEYTVFTGTVRNPFYLANLTLGED